MTKTITHLTKTLAVASATILGLSAMPAMAADGGLRIDAADLQTDEGVAQIHEMIYQRAEQACADRRQGTKMHDYKVVKICTERLTKMLIEKVGDPRLEAYHAEK